MEEKKFSTEVEAEEKKEAVEKNEEPAEEKKELDVKNEETAEEKEEPAEDNKEQVEKKKGPDVKKGEPSEVKKSSQKKKATGKSVKDTKKKCKKQASKKAGAAMPILIGIIALIAVFVVVGQIVFSNMNSMAERAAFLNKNDIIEKVNAAVDKYDGKNICYINKYVYSDGYTEECPTLVNSKGETIKGSSSGSYLYVQNSEGKKYSFIGTNSGELIEEERGWDKNLDMIETMVNMDGVKVYEVPYTSGEEYTDYVFKCVGVDSIKNVFKSMTSEDLENNGVTDNTCLKLYVSISPDGDMLYAKLAVSDKEHIKTRYMDGSVWQIVGFYETGDWSLPDSWYIGGGYDPKEVLVMAQQVLKEAGSAEYEESTESDDDGYYEEFNITPSEVEESIMSEEESIMSEEESITEESIMSEEESGANEEESIAEEIEDEVESESDSDKE